MPQIIPQQVTKALEDGRQYLTEIGQIITQLQQNQGQATQEELQQLAQLAKQSRQQLTQLEQSLNQNQSST